MPRSFTRFVIALCVASFGHLPNTHAALGPLAQISQVQSFRVQDDISVFLAEDHRAPLFRIDVFFPFGTNTKWVKDHHIRDAMSFQQTTPSNQFENLEKSHSIILSSSIGPLVGSVSVSGPKESLPLAIKSIRDLLHNQDFDPAKLMEAKWSAASLYELNGRQPQDALFRKTLTLFYTKGDPRLDGVSAPRKVQDDVKQLCEARDAYIRLPGRMITISGDVTKEEARTTALALQLPPPIKQRPKDLSSALLPFRRDRQHTEIPFPNITKVFFSYAREGLYVTHPDYLSFLVANHILVGSGFTSRLIKVLRQAHGDSYEVDASGGDDDISPSVYYITTSTKADNANAFEKMFRGTIAQFATQGMTEQELQEAKDYFRGIEPFHYGSTAQLLSKAITEKYFGLPLGYYASLLRKVQSLSLEEVNRFIRHFYDERYFTMIKLVPQK